MGVHFKTHSRNPFYFWKLSTWVIKDAFYHLSNDFCSDFICQCIWLHLCCIGTCKWRLQSFEWGRCDINSNIFGWKIFNFSEKKCRLNFSHQTNHNLKSGKFLKSMLRSESCLNRTSAIFG